MKNTKKELNGQSKVVKASDVDEVFNIWPDNDTVRHDLLDYAFEIEHFDNHLLKMINILEERDMLENTIIVVTSDNGMPFPRLKGQGYKYSHHMPLAIMWPNGIKNPGRIIDDFVSFTDFSPTFLESARIDMRNSGMEPMEGISLMSLFHDETGAKGRDYVIVGKERHDLGRPDDTGYPMRGIFTHELEAQEDPRIFGNGEIFMTYEYAQPHQRDFYNRFMNNEDDLRAGWINQTDIEKHKPDY